MKQGNLYLVLVPLGIGLSASLVLLPQSVAQPADSGSQAVTSRGKETAAAVANRPENRGRVIGAPCDETDGYHLNFGPAEELAAKRRAERGAPDGPINILEDVAPEELPPEPHELAPGQTYCLTGPLYPNGYLTSNCNDDRDCSGETVCRHSKCRAGCDLESDCPDGTTCSRALGEAQIRYCRCTECGAKD